MTEQWGEQMCFFDPDLWCGKMYPEACPAPVKDTAEKTSRPSSKKSAKSSAKKLPLFLCLKEAGPMQDASAEWVIAEPRFPSLGDFTIVNGGEFLNVENESVCLPILMENQQQKCYLSLNCGEKPRTIVQTRLSEILEESTADRYRLSERACLGILNRAQRRGKELPPELKEALLRQCGSGGCVQSDD